MDILILLLGIWLICLTLWTAFGWLFAWTWEDKRKQKTQGHAGTRGYFDWRDHVGK